MKNILLFHSTNGTWRFVSFTRSFLFFLFKDYNNHMPNKVGRPPRIYNKASESNKKMREVLKLWALIGAGESNFTIQPMGTIRTLHETLLLLRIEINRAIEESLTLQEKKFVIMVFVLEIRVEKIMSMCGIKFRVELYRQLYTIYEKLLIALGGTAFFSAYSTV